MKNSKKGQAQPYSQNQSYPANLKDELALSITIPRLPSAVFGGNSRQHWRIRYRESLAVYDEVVALVKETGYNEGMLVQPRMEIRWGIPDKRRRDFDNLVARTKPFIDGLVKAGVVGDDSIRDFVSDYGWFESPRKPMTLIKVYRRVDK